MSMVELKFRSNTFRFNCDNVETVQELAEQLIERTNQITTSATSNVTDTKILFLTALIMQDEINALKTKLEQIEQQNLDFSMKQTNTNHNMINHAIMCIEGLARDLENL